MKIFRQTKLEEYFLLTPRIGIKACVLMIPLLGVTWLFGLLLPVHKAFAYIFTILNSIQVSVRWYRSKSFNLYYYVTFWSSETPLQWSHDMFLELWKQKFLTMQEKTDFFFNYKICNFPSFLKILIDIWLICLHIVKINDPEIIFMLQGFPIFALHCMRNTQVRKKIKLIVNSISSSFSASIDIRVLLLRTILYVACLSADQRAIQKKNEYRFSIFYKEQLCKEEHLTRSSQLEITVNYLVQVLS